MVNPSTDIKIREAQPEDGPAVAHIYAQSADAHVVYDSEIYSAADTSSIASSFVTEGPMTHCSALLVAELDGDVVGFMQLEFAPPSPLPTMYGWSRGGKVEVEELAVEESLRGHGVGRLLLNAADAWAAERGVKTLALSCATANTGAQGLYKSEGYRETGVKFQKKLA